MEFDWLKARSKLVYSTIFFQFAHYVVWGYCRCNAGPQVQGSLLQVEKNEIVWQASFLFLAEKRPVKKFSAVFADFVWVLP
jgi:hypothetical protein